MTHSIARRLSYVVAYEKYGTAKRAAKAKGTTARTIERWVTRFAATGNVSDAPRSGRPKVKKIHSSRGRKVLKECVAKEMHAPRISRQLKVELNEETSVSTVQRALRGHGAKARKRIKKPLLTARHKKDRLKHCKHWKRHSWNKVMLSDSKYFLLYPSGRGAKVWVWDGNSPPPMPAVRGGFKVHFYAAVGRWGKTPLYMTAGSTGATVMHNGKKCKGVNQHVYQDLLREKMLPACTKIMRPRYGNEWFFQQDGARAHTAKSTLQFLREQPFKLMHPWPALSPDLTWIENLWAWVEKQLRDRQNELTSSNFVDTINHIWNTMPDSLLQKLADSVPRRLQECIDNEGGSTKY